MTIEVEVEKGSENNITCKVMIKLFFCAVLFASVDSSTMAKWGNFGLKRLTKEDKTCFGARVC